MLTAEQLRSTPVDITEILDSIEKGILVRHKRGHTDLSINLQEYSEEVIDRVVAELKRLNYATRFYSKTGLTISWKKG